MSVSSVLCTLIGVMCGDPQKVLLQQQSMQASDNLSRQSAEAMFSTWPMVNNWMLRPENRWKYGEFPVLEVYRNPTDPDQRFLPEPGLRIALDRKNTEEPQQVGVGQDRARLNIWFDPTGGIDPRTGAPHAVDAMSEMKRKTTSPGSILQALLERYQGGTENSTFAIGMAYDGRLREQHTQKNFRLPNAVLGRPVGEGSLMISGRTGGANGCGVLPATDDPHLHAPATEPPARRWHFDAWSVTTACIPAGWRMRQEGTYHGAPAWVPVRIYSKTQEVRGCNVREAFVPAYDQLDDPEIFAGLTPPSRKIPTGEPLYAPATNPSTYLVENCATNSPPPPIVQPPPTVWTETRDESCPAGWSGSITLSRRGQKDWILSDAGTFPPDSFTPWVEAGNTCQPPPPPPDTNPIVDPSPRPPCEGSDCEPPPPRPPCEGGDCEPPPPPTPPDTEGHSPGQSSDGGGRSEDHTEVSYDTDGDGITDSPTCDRDCRGLEDQARDIGSWTGNGRNDSSSRRNEELKAASKDDDLDGNANSNGDGGEGEGGGGEGEGEGEGGGGEGRE